jgi:polyketide cyclase/dehydrase/lipid transport protein/ABC transporter substrate binding protein
VVSRVTTRPAIAVILFLLAAGFFATVVAQPLAKPHRVGVLWPTNVSTNPMFDAFVHGLRDLGWVEGKDIVIEHRSAEGRADRLPDLAADLVRVKVDVILTGSTPAALAARKETGTIPIVMGTSGDPVRLGLVANLARPGGNVTGLAYDEGLQSVVMEDSMLELAMSVELGSPAETVWSVVGNFNGLPDWHPWVKSSVLDPLSGGVGRRVLIEGGTGGRRELHERLVSHDYHRREYAYAIIGGPTPRRDYIGRFRVLPKGPQICVVEFQAQYHAAPGVSDAEATERLRTFYGVAFDNLKSMFGG